jgi:hypothetical protein
MQEWFDTRGCDGFVLAATHLPGAFEEFVRMVVPMTAPSHRPGARARPPPTARSAERLAAHPTPSESVVVPSAVPRRS